MFTHLSPFRVGSVGTVLRRGLRAMPLASIGLVLVLAGCGVNLPVGGPPTAAEIFDRANHSNMKDAKIAMSGAITTSSSGTEFTLNMSGDGHIVLKPTSAYQMNLVMDMKSSQITGKLTVDLIQVDGKVYTKTQVDIPGLPASPHADKYTETTATASQTSLLPKNENSLKVVGEDTIRGDKCWHLQGNVTTNAQGTPVAAGTSGATSTKVDEWMRESDYYYVRLKLDSLPGVNMLGSGTASGASSGASDTGSGNIGFIVDFSDYDTGAAVSAPPASEITSGA